MDRSPLPEEKGPSFDPRTHWCARHLEPFRAAWPKGWALAMFALFELAHRRPDVQKAIGGDVRMLDRVLREYAPLCCLLGDEETAHWTTLALGPVADYRAAFDELRARPL